MINVVVMGECMVEFSLISPGVYRQSFAGDVYNTAVYLKRLQQEQANVSILSGIGNDSLSQQMCAAFAKENINCEYLQSVEQRIPGAYLIQTSDSGERSFVYWRDSSAAKFVLSSLTKQSQKQLVASTDMFYFSGISLAIITPEDRELLWQLLSQLRKADVQIVFDSNYRPRLWQSASEAMAMYQQAFEYSDVVFAGVEDFELLYELASYDSIRDYLKPFEISELIIKNGSEDVMCISESGQDVIAVTPVDIVVDSTSAGDSFNAGYLHARAQQKNIRQAVELACSVSGLVIAHQGAIVDTDIFSQFIAKIT